MEKKIRATIHIIILITALCLLLTGCKKQYHVDRAFYYWKTQASFTPSDDVFFKAHLIQSLYIRYFDIAWDSETNKPIPVSIFSLNSPFGSSGTSRPTNGKKLSNVPENIIPVVFITQEVIENIKPADIDTLGKNISTLIQSVSSRYNFNPKEIQLDSDWTFSTRGIYFGIIKQVAFHYKKTNPDIKLSATIRLHQVKYFRDTGVPPVDRGTLMVYNTGSLQSYTKTNTILDVEVAKGYLKNLSLYPLPLDIALPMFSWGIQFDSHERFIRLFQEISSTDLIKSRNYTKITANTFRATTDTMISDKRIMKNDIIKIDSVSLDQVLEISSFLKNNLNTKEFSVILFHYDPEVIKEFTNENPENLSRIFTSF